MEVFIGLLMATIFLQEQMRAVHKEAMELLLLLKTFHHQIHPVLLEAEVKQEEVLVEREECMQAA